MRWVAIVGGVLVALILAVVVVGALLPTEHVASRRAELPHPPEAVWSAITDLGRMPVWRRGITAVEQLPPVDGRRRWREVGGNGTITFEAVEWAPPSRLVARIADPDLPFGGRWIYELQPAGAGSVLTITEEGAVYNPVFRFMSRFVFGHHATMDAYLEDLEAHLSAAPATTR